ncbi:hypothetical protein HYQ44_014135 [Verticillium longisporum]|nr:hypothetical protein HYQ44_014135 [Verticillium longisporum]
MHRTNKKYDHTCQHPRCGVKHSYRNFRGHRVYSNYCGAHTCRATHDDPTCVAAIKAVGTLLSAHRAPSTRSSAVTMCAVPTVVTKQRVLA